MNGLSINGIVDVRINVLPSGTAVSVGCNKGLIVGDSEVITPEARVAEYNSLAEMIDAGFEVTDPEYEAAVVYFAQRPAPKVVFIGRHNTTSPSTETIEDAIADCLAKSQEWYGVYVCGSSDADIVKVAAALDGADRGVVFFENTNADCLVASPLAPDIFTALRTAKAERAIGMYSNSDYAGAALMGLAMGRETGLENSAFSLSYATMNGVSVEVVTKAQLDILMAKNGNVYITRGKGYNILHMGRCVEGSSYDDLMYLDMTKDFIEAKVMQVMTGRVGKLPQTDSGMAVIVSAVTSALEEMRKIGYLAEGIWTGEPIKTLETWDVVPGGYLVFAEPFASLSQADREARKSPPITVALKTSGTIESVVINVNVNL